MKTALEREAALALRDDLIESIDKELDAIRAIANTFTTNAVDLDELAELEYRLSELTS